MHGVNDIGVRDRRELGRVLLNAAPACNVMKRGGSGPLHNCLRAPKTRLPSSPIFRRPDQRLGERPSALLDFRQALLVNEPNGLPGRKLD